MSEAKDELQRGLDAEDPIAVAKAASIDEIKRLVAAENLLRKRHERKKRTTRFAVVAQALVGYVALAGFFANAYQNWNNKKQAEERARAEEERCGKEFKRAQDDDKYRAFFETSALATDPSNADKRLVGYALLKEFVDDKDYNQKATFMLEESLALELRADVGPGLDEPHRAATVAILSALSHTSDCRALARAARTIDKLALRHAQSKDLAEAREVVALYILRLVGRAAVVCSPKDFLDVRKPIRELVQKQSEMIGLSGKPSAAEVDKQIVATLRARCQDELEGGATECAEVPASLDKLCSALGKQKLPDSDGLCAK